MMFREIPSNKQQETDGQTRGDRTSPLYYTPMPFGSSFGLKIKTREIEVSVLVCRFWLRIQSGYNIEWQKVVWEKGGWFDLGVR